MNGLVQWQSESFTSQFLGKVNESSFKLKKQGETLYIQYQTRLKSSPTGVGMDRWRLTTSANYVSVPHRRGAGPGD